MTVEDGEHWRCQLWGTCHHPPQLKTV